MADGLGFEPKTALQLYSISSAAPSTGLGHPSSAGKVYRPSSGPDREGYALACVQSKVMSEPNEPADAMRVPLHVPVKLYVRLPSTVSL